MEDFGDIAYFIFLAIIFLAQFLFRKNKKNQRQQKSPSPERQPQEQDKSLEEMLEDVFGEKKRPQQPTPKPQQQTAPQPYQHSAEPSQPMRKKKVKKIEHHRDRAKQKLERAKSSLQPRSNTPKNIYQEYIEKNPQMVNLSNKRIEGDAPLQLEIIEDGGTGFDLSEINAAEMRKAVIYEAILQRKY